MSADNIYKKILLLSNKNKSKIDYQNKQLDFLKYQMTKQEYESLVCNPKNITELSLISPTIEFTTNYNKKIWDKILCYTSSIKTNRSPGKNVSYFVKDSISNKIIGLVSISSGQRHIKNRDTFFGWNQSNQFSKIDFIFNISTCVAVQPMGFNFNIGKLLAMSVFSREVQEKVHEKYNHYVIAYYTFSIHGRSVQYERIKQLKYCGLTSGQSFIIPDDLYEEMKDYLREIGIYDKIRMSSHLKRVVVKTVLEELEISPTLIYHNLQRGIYCGYCFPNAKEILMIGTLEDIYGLELGEDVKNFLDIYEYWKARWAEQRFGHLLKTGRVKRALRWSKMDEDEKNRLAQKKHQEKRREELGEEGYRMEHNERARSYYVRKEKKYLQPEYVKRIKEYKAKMTAKQIIESMKEEIPDLTENKIKKIWGGRIKLI